jgi:large subunit ribosomal protein L10
MSPKKINPKKSSVVSELTDLLSKSKSVAVVDYKGLKVNQATELRRAIKNAGGQIVVTKNTLFTIASGRKDLSLEGPSAFVFSLTDEVSAIKAVFDFAKKNLLPTFKMGLLDKDLLSADQITSLANLPSKETLIAKTVSTLKSPLFSLTYALNWNLVKLVRTLEEVRLSHVRRQSN